MKRFTLLLSIMLFALLSKITLAQNAKLVDSQCSQRILIGNNLVSVEIRNAELYEFHIYTNDSSFNQHFISYIPQLRSDEIAHLPLYETLNVKIRTKINETWSSYGQVCQIKMVLDCGFSENIHNILDTPEKRAIVQNRLDNLGSNPRVRSGNQANSDTLIIPIVFHIIVPNTFTGSNPYDYLSPAKINEALNILNDVFLGKTSENPSLHNTKIKFCPAISYNDNGVERSLSCDYLGETYHGITYNRRTQGSNINLPDNFYYPSNVFSIRYNNPYYNFFPLKNYLNIWIFDTHPRSVAAEAWCPVFSPYFANSSEMLGYIVVLKDFLGTNTNPGKIKGYSLPHEVGHYFGLQHTWGDITSDHCGIGDGITDTERHFRADRNCNDVETACSHEESSPIYNVMNYSPDACRHHFTLGQARRMKNIIHEYYDSLPINNRPNININDWANCDFKPSLERISIISPTGNSKCKGNAIIQIEVEHATNYSIEIYDNNNMLIASYNESEFELNNRLLTVNHNFSLTGRYRIVLNASLGNSNPILSTSKEIEIIDCNSNEIVDWEKSQWHFDTKMNLDFSQGVAQIGYSKINAFSCETSVCNSNGDLLFYTNGNKIWNYNHELQETILGTRADVSKGVIAIPIDTVSNLRKYMVVFFDENFHLNYKYIKVDNTNFSLDIEPYSSPLITQTTLNNLGLNNQVGLKAKALSACPMTDGNGFWLITSLNEFNTNSFKPVTIGINISNPSNINSINIFPSTHNFELSNPIHAGFEPTIKVSPNGKFVNYSMPYQGNFLYLFNASNGKFLMQLNCHIVNESPKFFEVAFSPSSRFMYFNETLEINHTPIYRIRQVDLNKINVCNCHLDSKVIFEMNTLVNPTYTLSTMFFQRGPDNKIYFTRPSEISDFSIYVGVINMPENEATANRFDNECFVNDSFIEVHNLSELRTDSYLPNFIDAKPNNCDIDFSICTNNCDSSTLQIINLSHGHPNEFNWTIFNANNTYNFTGLVPTNLSTLPVAENWTISLRKVGCNDSIVVSKDIQIISNPDINILGDRVICADNQYYSYEIENMGNTEITSSFFKLEYNNFVISSTNMHFEIYGERLINYAGDSLRLSVMATNSFGCESFDTIYIHIKNIDFSISTNYNCLTEGAFELEIFGNDNEIYNSTVNGISYPVSNGSNPPFTGLELGTHNYTLSNSMCYYTGSFQFETPVEIDYTLIREDCKYYSLKFNFNESEEYAFSLSGSNTNVITNNTGKFIIGPDIGDLAIPELFNHSVEVFVTVTDSNGCPKVYYITLHKLAPAIYIAQFPYTLSHYCSNNNLGSTQFFINGEFNHSNFITSIRNVTTNTTLTNLENYVDTIYDTFDGFGIRINNLLPGYYEISMNDYYLETSCDLIYGFEILDHRILNITSAITFDCDSINNHSITLNINNPSNNFYNSVVIWNKVGHSFSATTEIVYTQNNNYQTTISNLSPAQYSYRIFNNCGELITGFVNIENESGINISTNVTPQYGSNLGSVSISFQPTIGTGYSINILDNNNNVINSMQNIPNPVIFSNLNVGNYNIILTSPHGCISEQTFNIDSIKQISVNNYKFKHVTCESQYNGEVNFKITGGVPPYTVKIMRGVFTLASNLIYEQEGEYNVKLTNKAPSSQTINVHVTDASEYTIIQNIGALVYAWNNGGILLTSNYISSNPSIIHNYSNKTVCIGNASDQTLLINQNVTFSNCTIYTAVYDYVDVAQTLWTVAPGKKLDVITSVIIPGCEDKMWQGIKVDGNANVEQSYTYHGNVQLNRSEIHHAMKAVESVNGGIVRVNGTKFYNNVFDIYMHSYNFKYFRNFIKECNFITNKVFHKNKLYPIAHIYMNNVYGMPTLLRNNFINSVDYTPTPESNWENLKYYGDFRGIGINAINSSFDLSAETDNGNPAADNVKSRFEGLYYAIKVSGQKAGATAPTIKWAKFNNNFRGILLKNVTSPVVIKNEFNALNQFLEIYNNEMNPIGYYTPDKTVKYSLYLDACKTYSIEENTISNGDAGLYVNRSGDAGGYQIYRNSFGVNATKKISATVVTGKNSNFIQNDPYNYGQNGLEVKCNNYLNNNYSISVLNGNMRKNQGVPNGNTSELAGNQFHNTLVNTKEFTVQLSADYSSLGLGTYNYYQHSDMGSENNGYHRELVASKTSGVIRNTVFGRPFVTTESCPSNYTPSGIVINRPIEIGKISELNTEYSNLENEYNILVDKGNTQLMLNTAETMNELNYREAFNELSNSGYLSDSVYNALAHNNTAPEAAIAASLIDNSPLPENEINKINESYINDDLKNLVLSYQDGINSRQMFEYQLSDIKQEVYSIETDLMNRIINNDSIPEERLMLKDYFESQREKSHNAYMNIYSLNLAINDINAARNNLTDLRSYASTISNEFSTEIENYCNVSELYLHAVDNGFSNINLLRENKEFLLDAALDNSSLYSAQAQILYGYICDTVFIEDTPLPMDMPEERIVYKNYKHDNVFKPELKIYPNPTKGLLYIEYDFGKSYENGYDLLLNVVGKKAEDNCDRGFVKVYSNEGKLLMQEELKDIRGSENINLKNYSPGIYIIEISDCYNNTNSMKVTKQ